MDPSMVQLFGKFLGEHCTAAFKTSVELLKLRVTECSMSFNTGVGPQRQQSWTSGIKVQAINLKATYKV